MVELPHSIVAPPAMSRTAVSALFFANGLIAGCWSVFVPAIQRNLSIGESAIGLLILIGASAGFAGLLLSGPIIARVGSKAVATVAGLALAPGLLVLSLATDYAVAISLFVLFFLSMSVMDVAMNANGSDVSAPPAARSCRPSTVSGASARWWAPAWAGLAWPAWARPDWRSPPWRCAPA